MEIKEFMEAVDNDADINGVGITDEGAIIYANGGKWQITRYFIESNDWLTIRDILTGAKSNTPLYHISRVCGYYSRIENWNDSKKGEHLDRQSGDYHIQ